MTSADIREIYKKAGFEDDGDINFYINMLDGQSNLDYHIFYSKLYYRFHKLGFSTDQVLKLEQEFLDYFDGETSVMINFFEDLSRLKIACAMNREKY